MAKHTIHLPKRGGEGPDTPVVNATGQDQGNADTESGNGQAGDSGTAPPENNERSFEALELAVKAHSHWRNKPAMAYHPKPKSEMIQVGTSWVRVIVSDEVGFTLNSGEFVSL
jgi:hypothetical protein